MQTQMISNGAPAGEVLIVVPGGGVNDNQLGCQRQYGGGWYGFTHNPQPRAIPRGRRSEFANF